MQCCIVYCLIDTSVSNQGVPSAGKALPNFGNFTFFLILFWSILTRNLVALTVDMIERTNISNVASGGIDQQPILNQGMCCSRKLSRIHWSDNKLKFRDVKHELQTLRSIGAETCNYGIQDKFDRWNCQNFGWNWGISHCFRPHPSHSWDIQRSKDKTNILCNSAQKWLPKNSRNLEHTSVWWLTESTSSRWVRLYDWM